MVFLDIEKDGKWFFKYPMTSSGFITGENNGKIFIRDGGIAFFNKNSNSTREIKFKDIEEIEVLTIGSRDNRLHKTILIKSGSGNIYVSFFSRWTDFKEDLYEKAYKALTDGLEGFKLEEGLKKFKNELFEYIKPYDEITFEKLADNFDIPKNIVEKEIIKLIEMNSLKGRLVSDRIILREPTSKLEQTVYINIPPQTKITALKCPNCQAPLEFMPPCTCEHCGVLIELLK